MPATVPTVSVATPVAGLRPENMSVESLSSPLPGFSDMSLTLVTAGSLSRTPSVSVLVNTVPSGAVNAAVMVSSPTALPVIGISTRALPFSGRETLALASFSSTPTRSPAAVTSSKKSPAGPSTWVKSSANRERSPGARKFGSEAWITTGSRTRTSREAWPTPLLDQATAITFTVPLKSGILKEAWASPSAPTLVTPWKKATSRSVGGGPISLEMPPPSPPVRTSPSAPSVVSISWP